MTALVLFLYVTASAGISIPEYSLGNVLGGLVAVASVAWWCHSRHTVRSTRWVGIGVCVAFSAFIAVAYARYVDRPAYPDALSSELVYVLGSNRSLVTAFYCYERGGFIDHEWL